MADNVLLKNPCKSTAVTFPTLTKDKAQPWTVDRVHAVTRALPARYRMTSVLAYGCGLRQGETFGIAEDDFDFERLVVRVRRQVKHMDGQLVFALPKADRTREVPMSEGIAEKVRAHLKVTPAVEVTLPWEKPEGKPTTVRLVTTTEDGKALTRSTFNSGPWRAALVEAGALQPRPRRRTAEERARAGSGRVTDVRQYGMHALRHTYASVCLDEGENIRNLAEHLGHSDPGFTLRVYTHLLSNSGSRARRAIDRAFFSPADDPRSNRVCPTCAP
ncbi:tyrosine-type recombinase/integrase [Embleya sp. NBC_00888]|uniref:tyrosine-type recombinase/integrase n=1 Tax=Embleya sp. NBC_00888 TaxID=2975960 RepID=UPI003863480C